MKQVFQILVVNSGYEHKLDRCIVVIILKSREICLIETLQKYQKLHYVHDKIGVLNSSFRHVQRM